MITKRPTTIIFADPKLNTKTYEKELIRLREEVEQEKKSIIIPHGFMAIYVPSGTEIVLRYGYEELFEKDKETSEKPFEGQIDIEDLEVINKDD